MDTVGSRFAVFGNANLEVVATIGDFPMVYAPDRLLQGGLHPDASGVAVNVATALTALGNPVTACVTIGRDPVGAAVAGHLARSGLTVVPGEVDEQPVTLVLLDQHGRRLIVNDYRAAAGFRHDPATAAPLMAAADVVVLSNSDVNRDLLAPATNCGATVVCDVQAITSLDGPDRPFCQAADILFASAERLSEPAPVWLAQVMRAFPRCRIAVVGQGEHGATLAVRGQPAAAVPAAPAEALVSTLGAGDALLAGFLDGHTRGMPPAAALRRATVFAAAKLSAIGGATGFLDAAELNRRTRPPRPEP